MIQNLKNLPIELIEQKRFFLVGENKVPLTNDWSNPNNQKFYNEIKGIAGFDITGHGIGKDYIVLDFDHVIEPKTGKWINDYAKNTFKWIAQSVPTFIERSISKSGYHMILLPTAGVFDKISNSSKNTLYFIEGNTDSKLEIFYKTAGRYFLFTGDNCDCKPQTPIASGEKVDEFIKTLLDEIHKTKEKVDGKSVENYQKPKKAGYLTTNEVAAKLQVTRHAVEKWRNNGIFKEDIKDHNGVYWYSIERVEQLKSVYWKTTNVEPTSQKKFDDESDYERARTIKALFTIPCAQISYDDWINIGKALQSAGYEMTLWNEWSRTDVERYKGIDEISYKWQSFNGSGITIATLFDLAKQYGYDEKTYWHEWHNIHRPAQIKSKSIADDEENQVEEAIGILNSITDYTPADVFKAEIYRAAATCRLNPNTTLIYENFRNECKKNKDISMKTLNENIETYYRELKKAKFKVIHNSQNIPKENEGNTLDLPQLPDNINLKIENFIIPQNFNIYNGGMYSIDEKGNSNKFCNSTIFVIKEIVNIDEHIYKTQLACCKNGKRWIIPQAFDNSVIASAQKIVSLSDYGIDVNSNNAKTMIRYLDAFRATNCDIIPQVESVNKCGWRDEKTFITPYNQSDYVVDTSKNSFAANALTQKGDFNVWLDTFKEIREHTLARFINDAALATPLLYILDERSFSIYTTADSKAGKTATMKFGGSAWGNPDEIAKNFNCTINGLEVSAALRSDFPLIINEKQLAESQNKRNRLDMTKLLYLLGEGEGKSRMDRNANERKSYKWRTITLANGETDIISDETTQGAITRTLIFNVPDKVLPDELSRKAYRVMKRNYGHAGQIFIDNLLKENFEELRGQYETITNLLREKFNKHIDDHIRYVGVISLCDFMLNKYFFKINEKTAFEEAINLAQQILKMLKTQDELSDVKNEWNFLMSWIVENTVNFVGTDENDKAINAKTYGDFSDSEYRYIVAQPFKEAAEKAGYNYPKMIKDFAKAGYTITNNDGRHTVKRRIKGESPRCLKIPKEKAGTK